MPVSAGMGLAAHSHGPEYNCFQGAHPMASTLAAVFDDFDAAEQARERLATAGFRRDSIRVMPERSAWGTGDPTYGGSVQRESGLRGFFAELFGIGEDRSHEHYCEAVRRGSVVVAVEAGDEAEMARATEILEDCGAIDMDERVERWKAAGYQGYDEQAKPLTREEIARERQTLDVIQEEL